MYSRLIQPPERSFFLFGPRGTGKSSWARQAFADAIYLDLLESDVYLDLLAAPDRLGRRIPPAYKGWVIIDEVQKIPALLDEVHRLIERRRLKFVLTGSSARKLRRRGVNLLAGRALTRAMHPLTARELGGDFDLRRSLAVGQLPTVYVESGLPAARDYLASYVRTYLREEVQQEGLTRNLAAFGRFLEAASFSQGAALNVSTVARECAVERKVVEDYFGILDDLMLGVRLPVFRRRARRAVVSHPKFYLFDVGVFRTLRPRGPLDTPEEIDGPALETLLLQELRAYNDGLGLDYALHYWRTRTGEEVDFVLYGERGLHAIEVKRSARLHRDDFRGLELFLDEYPMARAQLFYGGTRRLHEGKIEILPFEEGLRALPETLTGGRP